MTGKRKRKRIKAHAWARDPRGFYLEERWCSARLLDVERFVGYVRDPACGSGRCVNSLIEAGYAVGCSDIEDRGFRPVGDYVAPFSRYDFLRHPVPADNFLSNPPFHVLREFTLQALRLARFKVALLWPVRQLRSAHWLEATPLVRMWFLTPRPSMPQGDYALQLEKQGRATRGGQQDFCWLVWDNEQQPGCPRTWGWLHRDRERQQDATPGGLHHRSTGERAAVGAGRRERRSDSPAPRFYARHSASVLQPQWDQVSGLRGGSGSIESSLQSFFRSGICAQDQAIRHGAPVS